MKKLVLIVAVLILGMKPGVLAEEEQDRQEELTGFTPDHMEETSNHLVPLPDIEVNGRQLLVNGSPFVMRGLCYAPTPVGQDYRSKWALESENYAEDFRLLREMGANTIRLFGSEPWSRDMLDAAHANELFVIIGLWVPYEADLSDAGVRSSLLKDFTAMIKRYKDHPAVLMWMFGTEVGKHNPYGPTPHWYTLVEEAAGAAHGIDNRPVTTAEVDGFNIGNPDLKSDDASMQHLDLWAVNTFWDVELNAVWDTVASSTKKPLWLEQIGIDAYNSKTKSEDEVMQARVIKTLWKNIEPQLSAVQPNGVCVGCTFFEWSDEWWKSNKEGGNRDHDTVADWQCDPYPDPAIQEEWFGVVAIEPDSTKRRPRKAYEELRKLWRPYRKLAGTNN